MSTSTTTSVPTAGDQHPAAGPGAAQVRRATGWYRLRVSRLEHVGERTVAISLDVPDRWADVFAHRAGQHVAVRHHRGGDELRRSYSLCLPHGASAGIRLVVKRLGADGFGDFATSTLSVGDHLELAPPSGDFRLAEASAAHHVLVAGGSGITPLLSMAVAALRSDPRCRVSLLYANRTAQSVLLADELADLKDAYADRFFVLHVLSRESQGSELLSGRIDVERLPGLLRLLGATPGDASHFYLCGPLGLVETVRTALARWGAAPGQVRFELFTTGGAPRTPQEEPLGRTGRITARLDGRTTEAVMFPEDRVLLDAVLRARPETPYSCRDGLCGGCRAKVTGGSVLMGRQYALGPAEISAGYTLTCRARPESDEVALDFDA
ncbi:2Fe-2S iron-sulfur cluster-binding protein [Streptomyces sp. NPDC048577]|uniref:2Fe-2S iron-sulfur cluster-binding protein n=1 Tax=Streptomyces sp. NPDC048577 TaxID=3157209 RepID=UPI00343229CA